MQNDFPNASQNQLKKWARLADAKFRREDGLFLAEGVKVVEELLRSDWQAEAILVLPEKTQYWEKLLSISKDKKPPINRIKPSRLSFPRRRESSIDNSIVDSRLRTPKDTSGNDAQVPVYYLSRSEFKKLSQDKEPEGMLAVVKMKEQPDVESLFDYHARHLLIAHEISNPQNLGALLRTARWFGITGIVLGSHSVDWTNPKVIRASMGSAFHLTIWSDMDLSTVLTEIKKNFKIIGSDAREGVQPRPMVNPTALLLGSESHGLTENLLKLADERWRIPSNTETDSLSLPQAAAIMMYEMTKKG